MFDVKRKSLIRKSVFVNHGFPLAFKLTWWIIEDNEGDHIFFYLRISLGDYLNKNACSVICELVNSYDFKIFAKCCISETQETPGITQAKSIFYFFDLPIYNVLGIIILLILFTFHIICYTILINI